MRKHRPELTAVLNRLFQIVHRSLPMYLAGADPWSQSTDEPALTALGQMIADAQFYSGRLADMILQHRGRIDPGDFPMEFTDLNMLSMQFLISELVRDQVRDIAAIQDCVAQLSEHLPAKVLAEEVLGNARGHLQTLEELSQRPLTAGPTAA